MRILWLNHRDLHNPRAGGAERTVHEITRRLCSRGHRVTLIAGGWRGSSRYEVLDGVKILRVGTNVLPHLAVPLYLSKSGDIDVIVDDLAHAVPWATEWITNTPGTVFFRHLHARSLPGQVSPPLASILTLVEKHYGLIYPTWPFVTESASSEEDLTSLGVPLRRITRIPPGVDTLLFKPIKKSPTPQIVYFGGLRRYKRPFDSLTVLKLILQSGREVSLVIVGDGPLLPDLRAMASKLGLSNHVTFLGRLPDEVLAQTVGRSWLNIHCSTSEGWGLSVVEAAAAGVPTVAYAVPGITDTVRDGKTGRLVADGDVRALSVAAEEVLASPEEWTRRCIERREDWNWDATANLWERHLYRVSTFQSK